MKSILTIVIFLSLVVSGATQTRNVVVGTNGAVVSPTNFWSADVTNARSGLGLGSAATSASTAFQPSSATLSNLAVGNGVNLTNITATVVGTNIPITNVIGLQTALDGKLATNGNTTGTASNVTGVVALVNGGTAGTNAASARTSLGATTVGGNIFTLANPDEIRFLRLNANSSVSALTAADFRTAIGVSTGVGTVTSVGMTVPAIFSLSTPTITSSGTFALTLANQTSRQVFIAPNGGGIPAFRGVESDDLPSLAISKITGLQTALDGKLATGGTATLATNVTGIVALANGGTGGSNATTARTGLGATTVGENIFTLLNPSAVRFLRLNADNTASALSDSDFRTAIGLGTAATNPTTAFQPSSTVLSNLSSSNGASLTNIPVAGVVGALATNGSAAGLANFPTVALASNVTGTIAISNGGSGSTTAGGARTNLGLGATWLTNTNVTNFRSAIGLGVSSSVQFDAITAASIGVGVGATSRFTVDDSMIEVALPIEFAVGSAAGTRTNLGLGGGNSVVFSNLTLSNGAQTNLALAIGSTNRGFFATAGPERITTVVGGVAALSVFDNSVETGSGIGLSSSANVTVGSNLNLGGPILFINNGNQVINAATSRTNLGLGWPALTNSNAGSGLVSVNTNGVVVSPTNFWQVAPIVTTFIESQPVVSQTTNIAAGRNLHIHSLAFSTVGITNTIALPTTNSFNGDIALVVHQGPTSSVTAVRTAGAATNLITLNQFEQTVEFVYYNSVWQFNHNLSFIEPIFFSGTNAAANAAASRTNLGLGLVALTNTNNDNFRLAIGIGELDTVRFGNIVIADSEGISFDEEIAASTTRINLGIPLAALTNTNKANFQAAIFNTNSAPTNGANVNAINFNTAIHWMEVNVVTNGVTNNFRIPLFK